MKLRCNLSCIPLRKSNSDSSEMVSQILYGEDLDVVETKDKWLKVNCIEYKYTGWIATEHELPEVIVNDNSDLKVKHESLLPQDSEGYIRLSPGSKITHQAAAELISIESKKKELSENSAFEIARQFLHSPYLWGGRSIWGIDCSGLVQVCFSLLGASLERDASQQALEGERISFSDSKSGDLAFFSNAKGNITHVGIIGDNFSIIHASGKVRIDTLTEQGIKRSTDDLLTHNLSCIRRINISALA